MTDWKIGDRVVTCGGDVGVIEEFDDGMFKVRLMTPDNEPSCCSSWCMPDSLSDGANVIPQPRSREWKRQSALFVQAVTGALNDALRE